MTYSDRPGPAYAADLSLPERARNGAVWVRDTLDQGGRPLWLAAMILGFVIAAPLGFAILIYMLWSKRMFGHCKNRHARHHERHMERKARWTEATGRRSAASGNSAFDAYRDETLRRLEDEHEQFLGFLGRLRDARDKAEFDQFMQERRATAATGPAPTQPEAPAQG